MNALRLIAGPRARERIARDGLSAQSIAGIAAAAGGPKGLAFLPLDEWLFAEWLPSAPRHRLLAGASIGAWRMAAAVHRDGAAATRRLGEAYLECQRYPLNPSQAQVSNACRDIVQAVLGEPQTFIDGAHANHSLAVITARARGAIARRAGRRNFARPALANLVSRGWLGRHLQRVVFELGPQSHALWPHDSFNTQFASLCAANATDALLASGSIPLVACPVVDPAQAPTGQYWDGGLIDYHLHLQWQALDGIILCPHFAPWLTPGWLDKSLPWRRKGLRGASHWLDNVLILTPSPALMARLPGGKLPERQDFHRFGLRHDERIQAWRKAMAECQAMADDLATFVARPDPSRLEPF